MIKKSTDIEAVVKSAMLGGNGDVMFHHLASKEELLDHARLFSILTLEKGCGIGYHVHEGETEMFYFAAGAGRVCDDGEWYDIAAGDSMTTPGGHGHAVENTGDTDLVLVAVIVLD